jgi:hypothetical protein
MKVLAAGQVGRGGSTFCNAQWEFTSAAARRWRGTRIWLLGGGVGTSAPTPGGGRPSRSRSKRARVAGGARPWQRRRRVVM